MNNYFVIPNSKKSKDDLIFLWHQKRNQNPPLGTSEAQKIFTNE